MRNDPLEDVLQALKTTAGNIQALGPAGAIADFHGPYQNWLAVIEDAIRKLEAYNDRI